jgi:hypothetical protein
MLKTILNTVPRDNDYPERHFKLKVLSKILDGTIYDNMRYDFHQEVLEDGSYIPLSQRRPSVRYNLSRTVVDDSVSMLFSDGHFPKLHCDDEDVRKVLNDVIKEAVLNQTMMEACYKGSVGSVAILFQVFKNRVFFTVLDTLFLTPTWDPFEPDTLINVRQQYKARGKQLREYGFNIPKDNDDVLYWFCRDFTKTQDIVYNPWECGEEKDEEKFVITVNKEFTRYHNFGFVPVEWIKNLPGGDDIDGQSTFGGAVDTQIEIEYLLSQSGRGLKYSSDPTLLIKDPSGMESGNIVKGAGNALVVSHDGDASMLEINGKGAAAMEAHVKLLREFALEVIHGNRAHAERMGAATSGRAMELMNQAIVWLADKLRVSYGEKALTNLLKMVVKASHAYDLIICGKKIGKLNEDAYLTLKWPAWYQPTAADEQANASALALYVQTGVMSKETAITSLASTYDIEDTAVELEKIEHDQEEEMERQTQLMEKQAELKPQKPDGPASNNQFKK